MSNSYDVVINNNLYFKKENVYYEEHKAINNYDISSSIPINETEIVVEEKEWKTLKNFILNDLSEDSRYFPNDDVIKQDYLDAYSQVLQSFILSAKKSCYLRPYASLVPDANNSVTGIELYKKTPFYQLTDIQELKSKISNFLTSNPCIVMDTNQEKPVEPLLITLIKGNFQLLCRAIITSYKLQNIFLCSIFDNQEFYKSGNYQDSTIIDHVYSIFKQKVSNLIPKYIESLKVYLNEELSKLVSNGEDLYDPISNEKIVFETPLSPQNYSFNIEKYIKYLFLQEFIFISQKTNTLFNLSGSDPVSNQLYSFAPTTSFGQNKLLTAKEYFIEDLYIAGLSSAATAGDGINSDDRNYINNNGIKLFLEAKTEKDISRNRIKTVLSLKMNIGETIIINLLSSDLTNTLSSDIVGNQLLTFINGKISMLKQLLLAKDEFLILANYVFPVNKILNIASLFHHNMTIKTYGSPVENLGNASVKTADNTHKMARQADQSCETPSPIDLDIDDMIFSLNAEIIKALLLFPIQVIKGIEETFDLNIVLANQTRTFAEALGVPRLPIAIYSAPWMLPPPYGKAILPNNPYGYVYWSIDAAETMLAYAKDGFQLNTLDLDFKISEDPLKPDC